MILKRITPEHIRFSSKLRVEPVDAGHQQGFGFARGPIHGVKRDPTIDPGAVVPGEKKVWQWRQHKSVVPEVVAEKPGWVKWQIGHLKPTNKVFRKLAAWKFVHPGAQVGNHPDTDVVPGNPVIQNPFSGFGDVQSLGQ